MKISPRSLKRRHLLVGFTVSGVMARQCGSVFATEKSIAAFIPRGSRRASHARFDGLLKTYALGNVERDNLIDYRSLKRSGSEELKMHIAKLEELDLVSLLSREALTYWINFHNVRTLNVVLEYYRISSMKKYNLGCCRFFKSGPWSKKIANIDGTDLSVDYVNLGRGDFCILCRRRHNRIQDLLLVRRRFRRGQETQGARDKICRT